MKLNPNPQGKGLVSVLEGVASGRPRVTVPPKQIDQIASELFTSMFILESQFSFKPVVNNTYYLYREGTLFRLSLIEPERWPNSSFGQYVGECQLQPDITWTLLIDDAAMEDESLVSYIEEKKLAYDEMLMSAESLDEVLPTYCEKLSFHRRVFASGLAFSLGASMELSGIKALSYSEAKGLLEKQS